MLKEVIFRCYRPVDRGALYDVWPRLAALVEHPAHVTAELPA